MSAPELSKLDANQCIQGAYDQDKGRLRVDAELTASIIAPPGLEVSINAVDDNIAIRNSTNSNELLINPDGSINVTSVITGSPDINIQKVGGTTTSVNNGIATAGTLRVAIASDNTPFSVNSVQSGTWTTGRTWTLSSGTDSVNVGNFPSTFSVTQSTSPWIISGTVTANIGTTGGLALDSSLTTINTTLGSPFQAGGSISNTSFIATQTTGTNLHTVVDSGTITTITNPVTVSQSTAANLNATVVGTGTFAVQATQAGTWNINNISGTISLPTGASTSALQTTGNTSLASIDSKIPSGLTVTSNRLLVDGSGVTQPISGTITANQGTSPWVVSGTVTATLSYDQNYGTVGASTLRTAAQIGNATGAALFGTGTTTAQVLRVVLPTDQTAIPVTQSGSWTTGRTWTLSSGTDSIASVQSGTWNINNISGTISLPTGAATEATLATLSLSPGSTTSGEKGPLVQGAVTTSAPTYTTGQTNPLSLTTSGLLRVDASGTTIPISGTVAVTQSTSPWVSNITQFGSSNVVTGTGASGSGIPRVTVSNDSNILATQSGTWNINNITGTVGLQVDRTATGTITASGQTVVLNTVGCGTATIAITGTGTATIVFEQYDGANWWSLSALDLTLTPGMSYAIDNTNFGSNTSFWQANVAGVSQIRVRSTTSPSPNTLTIYLEGSQATARDVTFSNNAYVNAAQYGTWSVNQAGTWNIGSVSSILSSVAVTQAGTWNLNNITGSIVLPTGASTSALQTAGNNLLTNIQSDTDQLVSMIQFPGTGSASAASGYVSFGTVNYGTASFTDNTVHALQLDSAGNLKVYAPFLSLSANQTTSSQSGPLVQGSVTTNAPSYTDAKTNYLSLDTSGNLRIIAPPTASNFSKAEDVASANADVGVPAMAIRKATPANTSGTDGDYEMLQISAGRLWASATIDAALPAGGNVIGHVITDSGTITAVTSITNPVSTKTALTSSSPTAATVGVASGTVIASNVNRKGLILINTSSNTISLAIGTTAVLNSGITLFKNGGVWVMDEFNFTTGQINGIASAASSNIAIQEFTT